MDKQAKQALLSSIFVFILVAVIFIGYSSFAVVEAGHRGVVFNQVAGVQDKILQEGLNFKVPFLDKVIAIDIREDKLELKLSSTSKDQQIVDVVFALNYKLDQDNVNNLYKNIGLNYKGKILHPIIEDGVKTAMAQFKAEELITKRSAVSNAVLSKIREKCKGKHIIALDANIINIKFSNSYNDAIEKKVIAEQQEQKAINDLKRIEIEAKQKIVQAEAQANSNLIKAEAEAKSIEIQQKSLLNSKEILILRWIEKWNGIVPTITTSGDSSFIYDLNKIRAISKKNNKKIEFEID